MSNIDKVKDILGCSRSDASHYLKAFGGDEERTVQGVLQYGSDEDWWAHPWNDAVGRGWETSSDEILAPNIAEREHESEVAAGDSRSLMQSSAASETKEDASIDFNEEEEFVRQEDEMSTNDSVHIERRADSSVVAADELIDDCDFYSRYRNLVDGFVDTVCHEESNKRDLRALIAEADAVVARETGSELLVSDLVNRLSFRHVQEGRTALSYAVAKNLKQKVYDLIDLGADVSKAMPQESEAADSGPKTALSIAATNEKRDGTDMVRILLSKGADPSELVAAGVDEESLGRGMKYWIDKARRVGVPNQSELHHMRHTPPMDRLHELDYAVMGEEAAVSVIQEAFAGRFGNPQGNNKPLVLLLLGPPGHGKTYFSSNAARSLVGEDNFLFVPCQSIRDDADLFGSRLGGARGGEYSSDGQLTAWLRARQGKKCVVFLDEFEKMQELTSALGWGQAKKIYQSFLEPWNDGALSDQGALSGSNRGRSMESTSAGGHKIDCSQCIWIMTSNWGQREIIDFYEKHRGRMQRKIDQKDVAWIQKHLVAKILRPLCIREFGSVHEDVKALCRRIDAIVPFLPFTPSERKVVADTALIERFSLYREPCILTGPEEKRRSFGNLHLRSTRAFASYAAGQYDPMQGASGMLSAVQQADGKFQMMSLRDQLGLTDEQKLRVRSSTAVVGGGSDEPNFWVHYDKDCEEITISQARPADDDDHSECSDNEGETLEADDSNRVEVDAHKDDVRADDARSARITRTPRPGAADDAF